MILLDVVQNKETIEIGFEKEINDYYVSFDVKDSVVFENDDNVFILPQNAEIFNTEKEYLTFVDNEGNFLNLYVNSEV